MLVAFGIGAGSALLILLYYKVVSRISNPFIKTVLDSRAYFAVVPVAISLLLLLKSLAALGIDNGDEKRCALLSFAAVVAVVLLSEPFGTDIRNLFRAALRRWFS